MRTQIVLAAVAGCVLLAGACGSQTIEPQAANTSSTTRSATTTATIPPHEPEVVPDAWGTVSVVVAEPASRSQSAVRYVRIEDAEGQLVVEREYRSSPAKLREQLVVGKYRVVSWVRECGGSCEGKTDPDFAPPTRICGVRVEVGENATAEVTINAPAGMDCTAVS